MQIEKARDKVSGLELIDTCWDVNNYDAISILADRLELIDTCWDVNPYQLSKRRKA